MRGRIYSGRGEWELLPELAAHGRDVLAAGAGDAHVRREIAETLLAIPAMEEAAAYLQEWIAAEGPDVERLGMLAWAQACRGRYADAEGIWAQELDLARQADPQKVEAPLAQACEALVDAFSAAGEGERAARVAREGWTVARQGPVSSPSRWMAVAYQAGMDMGPVAQTLLGRLEGEEGLEAEVEALILRAWTDEPEEIVAAALDLARACLAAGRVSLTGRLREVGNVFRPCHGPRARTRLAQEMWELLADHPDARTPWGWDRFDVFAYLHAGLLDEAAALARQHYEEAGLPAAGNDLIVASAALGEPAPPEVVQALKAGGIEAVDEYGLFGWYLRGRVEEALEALRTSLDYWSNPPLGPFAELWEQDRAWDPMRDDPRYQQIWADKRARIGPIHGNLHYFPGW
jgi:tetratricopeptide (TPR) repeat protein